MADEPLLCRIRTKPLASTNQPESTPFNSITIKPIWIGILSIASAMAGGYLKDRLEIQDRTSQMHSQVESNSKRTDELQVVLRDHLKNSVSRDEWLRNSDDVKRSYVQREEFNQFTAAMKQNMDDLRSDVKDIKEYVIRRK